MVTRNKVFACITRGDGEDRELLLLLHPDHPNAGIQLPAGTIRSGEEITSAALREAREETGLTGLAIVRVLGETLFDMEPFGKPELHRRTFVHLHCRQSTPDHWEHWEEDPSDGSTAPIRFALTWCRLTHLPALIAEHDAFVHEVTQ